MSGLLTPVDDGKTLDKLNLTDNETQLKILSYDKHQTIEGLFIEPFAMNYMNALASFGVKPVEVVTVFAKHISKNHKEQLSRCIFVWNRKKSPETESYINLLASLQPETTFEIEFSSEDSNFICFKPGNPDKKFPLQEYLRRKRDEQTITFPDIATNVRDGNRQKSAFWGRLTTVFKTPEEFRDEVLLNRMIKNFAIQPFFKYLWDLDRIISYKNCFWEVELKHKYPFYNYGKLAFGINLGQARLIRELANIGLNTLHLILVKPTWRKDIDPGYIFNQKDIHRNVLLIGTVLNKEKIDRVLNGKLRESNTSTSYSGRNKLQHYSIPATSFYCLGTYEDPIEKVSQNILNLLESEYTNTPASLPVVSDQLLLDNRL